MPKPKPKPQSNSSIPSSGSSERRIAAVVEYNGRNYFGWQRQSDPATPGVQSSVEQALSVVADHPVDIICAGRTDTGVHATHQVIHFDSAAVRSERQWMLGANANLPTDIRIRWTTEATHDFHARFSATARQYVYCIDNRPVKPGVFHGMHSWCRLPLDAQLMQNEASVLVGEHDFTSFRAAGCQSKSPWRNIMAIEVRRQQHLVIIDIKANAFLQHMVRNIAGVLMAVGSGERRSGWTTELLEACDRKKGGVTALPDGLFLVGVDYPKEFGLPSYQLMPSFWGA